MHPQQTAVVAAEDQFQKTIRVAGDSASGIVRIMSTPDRVGDSLFSAGLFGLAYAGNLGNSVNTHGQHMGEALLVLKSEGVTDGHAPLLHGGGGQSGKSDDVARSVDMRHPSLIKLVYFEISALGNS